MKERQKLILEYIIEHSHTSMKELLRFFSISKRTLYYDIESINYYIRNIGQIKNINGELSYIGAFDDLLQVIRNSEQAFDSMEGRKNYILYKILNQETVTTEWLMQLMQKSKNTIVQTLEECKQDVWDMGLRLVHRNGCYHVEGKEQWIRDLYLILMQEDNNLINYINKEILDFDQRHQLSLTDHSLSALSKFVSFIQKRMENACYIDQIYDLTDLSQYSYCQDVDSLLREVYPQESNYLAAYIASLSNLKTNSNQESIDMIDTYIDKLVMSFEARSAVALESKEEFKRNMKQHLLSSYYRIKYRFPIHNPSLAEIKRKHAPLFTIIKSIIENEIEFPDFAGIREEEIGFLAMYFGGYLKGSRGEGRRKNRVIIVCPNGLMASKTIEIQLYKYIPAIEVVDSIPLSQLSQYVGNYDYIVSTIEIPNYENVILVKPLLTKMDIDLLLNKLIAIDSNAILYDIDAMIDLIRQSCFIKNEEKLTRDLKKLFYRYEEKETHQPMLKELLSKERINKIDDVSNWEEAIKLASKPLLQDNSITEAYVMAMIDSIKSHGPYIVLADYFALPHASSNEGVNQLAMSLLIVKEPVDLLGKPVHIFMVLATIDSTSHIKALASLAELMYNKQNIEVFKQGDASSILELIYTQEEEVKK